MGGRGPLATLEKLELVLGSNSSGFARSRSLASPTRIFRSTISPLVGWAIVSKNLVVWMKRLASKEVSIN